MTQHSKEMLQDAISRRLLRRFLYPFSYIYMELYLHEIHAHIELLLGGTLICFPSNTEEFIYSGMFFVATYGCSEELDISYVDAGGRIV
jgi:hypothetical protein